MYNRRLVFIAACLSMLLFGIELTTLGAVLPSLIERFGIDNAYAGSLFTLMSFGILVGSLLFGPVVDRYGYKSLLAVSALLTLAGLEGIAFAPSLAWLKLAIFMIGLAGGVINGGTNAVVADISEDSRSAGLALLGVFFGLGAVGVPYSMSFLLKAATFSQIIAGVGLVALIPLTLITVTAFPKPKQAQGFPLTQCAGLIKDPTLLGLGCLLFLQSGMEISVGGWTNSYFKEVLHLQPDSCLKLLSLYWFGMLVARLLLGSLLARVPSATALLTCVGIALAGSVLMVSSETATPAAVGIFAIGAGFAAGYPVILGIVGDRYAKLSGTAFSVVLTMALVGGMIVPNVMGVLGTSSGLRTSFLIIPACLVLQAILFVVISRVSAFVVTVPSKEDGPVS